MTLQKQDLAIRFWSKVDVRGPDDCWPWMAATDSYGYGKFGYDGQMTVSHRVAFYLSNGYFSPVFTCHSCDNPPCVNPKHLFEGTNQDNVDDSIAKGRKPRGEKHAAVTRYGEQHGCAKLTAENVRNIRIAVQNGSTHRSQAEKYGVVRKAISLIISGKNWRRVK